MSVRDEKVTEGGEEDGDNDSISEREWYVHFLRHDSNCKAHQTEHSMVLVWIFGKDQS